MSALIILLVYVIPIGIGITILYFHIKLICWLARFLEMKARSLALEYRKVNPQRQSKWWEGYQFPRWYYLEQ